MAKVYPKSWFECMHLIGQNKHSKFTYNTLRILPVTMTCAVLYRQTYLGMYSSAFCHIWVLKKAFEKSNKCQRESKSEFYMLGFDWLQQTDKIGCNIYLPCENDLCRTMVPYCLGILSSTLCQMSALKEKIGYYVYDNTIFLKWGILNVPFCSIFVYYQY